MTDPARPASAVAPQGPAVDTEHKGDDAEARDGIVVAVTDESEAGPIDLEAWRRVGCETLQAEGVTTGRLDLIFVDRDAIAELNREHLGNDRPTDVLAFPLDGPSALDENRRSTVSSPEEPERHLGDIVVCWEIAADQASAHAGTVEAELTLLVVHGVLHVLGHDHAEPAETLRMQDRERTHLRRYGFEHPVRV